MAVTITAPAKVMTISPAMKVAAAAAQGQSYTPTVQDQLIWDMFNASSGRRLPVYQYPLYKKLLPSWLTVPAGHEEFITGITDVSFIDWGAIGLILSFSGEVHGRSAFLVMADAKRSEAVPVYIPGATYVDENEDTQIHTWLSWATAHGRIWHDESDGGDPAAPTGNKLIECSNGNTHFLGSVLYQLHAETGLSVTLEPDIYQPPPV